MHIISQSDINAGSSPSNEEKAKRLEATALLVKETSNIYLRGNDDSSNHYFFKVNSSSQIELLRISITTGIIYRTNTQFIDVGSIRYDRAQSLTEDQKALVRENIDAASKEEVLPLTIDISSTSVEDYNTALEAFNSKKPLTIFNSSDPTARFTSTTIEKETDTNDINIYFSFTGINNDDVLITIGYIAKIKSTGEKTVSFAYIAPSDSAPRPLASVASPGTDNAYSRSDHVHPAQESVAKLATPRVIAIAGAISGSATFDGSSNVSIDSTLNDFDASKITSGTLNADRLPEIPISKIPAGAAAGFGTPTVDNSAAGNVGTPSVTVTASGANTSKVFNFKFSNLKGATGAQGPKGDKGDKGDTGATGPAGTYTAGSGISISGNTISAEIPVALPNPYALTINGTSYTGSSAVSISTSKPLSVRMLTSSTVDAGYSYSCGTSKAISTLNGFSSTNPDSVIISSAKLTFTASNVIKMDGLDDLSGT